MGPSNKLLGEWFWTDRWIGSSAFLLPMEPRGLYREMLTQAWRRGARLPADHEMIRRATGCTEQEWLRCWPLIEPYWRQDGDSLVNNTQLTIYARTYRLQAVRRAAGAVGYERVGRGVDGRFLAISPMFHRQNRQTVRHAGPANGPLGGPPVRSRSGGENRNNGSIGVETTGKTGKPSGKPSATPSATPDGQATASPSPSLSVQEQIQEAPTAPVQGNGNGHRTQSHSKGYRAKQFGKGRPCPHTPVCPSFTVCTTRCLEEGRQGSKGAS